MPSKFLGAAYRSASGIFRFLIALSLPPSLSLPSSLPLLSLIPNIGVSVYVIHLPWIAVYNFRAAICAATRSSSACECISGTIFLGAPAEGGSVFPFAIVRNSAARLIPRNYILRTGSTVLLFPIELHHSLWLLLIEIQDIPFVKRMPRFMYWITV